MKRFLLLWLMINSVCAQPILKNANESSSAWAFKKELANKVSASFLDDSVDDIVNLSKLPNNLKIISTKEFVNTENIGIAITNNIDHTVTVTAVALEVNGKICGFNKNKIVLPPKQTVRGFIFGAEAVGKCIKTMKHNLEKDGRADFIDVGTKFDMQKFDSLDQVIYMYPLHMSIVLQDNLQYINYQKTLYAVFLRR